MIDMLKNMAMQKLAEKMGPNSLNAEATTEAANEGAGALIEKIQAAVAGGNIGQVKDLFSTGGTATADNGIFQDVMGKMTQILQDKGMNADEAQAEAGNALPDLINSLQSKFASSDAADSAFDLGAITQLVRSGDVGSIIGKVKSLF